MYSDTQHTLADLLAAAFLSCEKDFLSFSHATNVALHNTPATEFLNKLNKSPPFQFLFLNLPLTVPHFLEVATRFCQETTETDGISFSKHPLALWHTTQKTPFKKISYEEQHFLCELALYCDLHATDNAYAAHIDQLASNIREMPKPSFSLFSNRTHDGNVFLTWLGFTDARSYSAAYQASKQSYEAAKKAYLDARNGIENPTTRSLFLALRDAFLSLHQLPFSDTDHRLLCAYLKKLTHTNI